MKWQQFFQAIMQTEENILPLFIHSAQAQKITGVVLVGESAVGGALVDLFGHPTAPAPVSGSTPAPTTSAPGPVLVPSPSA